jgi:hypothetical protein
MFKRLIGRFKIRIGDWLLRRIPCRAIPVKSAHTVQVMLMADTGEQWLAQLDWQVTDKDFPALKKADALLLAIRVWQDGDTSTNLRALAHLLPDKEDSYSSIPNNHANQIACGIHGQQR